MFSGYVTVFLDTLNLVSDSVRIDFLSCNMRYSKCLTDLGGSLTKSSRINFDH